jgi:hypothetical protein
MKKIIFYTQNRWAFGSIHHSLCKELYKHGIFANVLSEDGNYTKEEFSMLNSTYDLFVTNPDKVLHLHQISGIPLKKITAIAHGQWDILLTTNQENFYTELYSFGVISNILKKKCEEWQLSVVPKVVELGINFDYFYSSPSDNLRIVGYAGAKQTFNYYGEEIKRGYLVEEACKDIDSVNLQPSGSYNFLCMPGYYKTVDCIVTSSAEEGGGLPMLEAAAAGRLTIGTPVGYFEENAPLGGGCIVSLEEKKFITQTKELIKHYSENSVDYKNKCLEIQSYAKDNYDWSKKIDKWVELLK